MDVKTIAGSAMGVVVFFLLLGSLVTPLWKTAATTTDLAYNGTTNITGTGLTTAGWQGILLVVAIAFIFYGALKFMGNI